jgi:hypothetical protein
MVMVVLNFLNKGAGFEQQLLVQNEKLEEDSDD